MKISTNLIAWYKLHKRDLPWRETTDPYKIWLSEVMLQQTRVQQGLPYYIKFTEAYPTIKSMAAAEEKEILTLWQGLGYYSRARNMHHTAKQISFENKGVFPSDYTTILSLKGVGEYTAAAIASFAFGLPHPVIDGNVIRVVSRLFAIEQPVNKPSGLNQIKQAVAVIFDSKNPATWNQAIMEFGSLHCTVANPKCSSCPLAINCLSKEKNLTSSIPHKEGKTKIKEIEHTYLSLVFENKTYIQERKSGIWQGLFQFPLIEARLSEGDILKSLSYILTSVPKCLIEKSYSTTHLLSHRKINAVFYTIYLNTKPLFLKRDIFEIELDEIGSKYPTSNLILKYINQRTKDDK